MDQPSPPLRDQMFDARRDSRRIVDVERRAARAVLGIDQDGGHAQRQRLVQPARDQLRRHDDQPVDAAAHRPHRLRRPFGIGMHVGQQQVIAARRHLAVHAAHDLGKELAVQVGQDDTDRMAARQRQAACARMGDIASDRAAAITRSRVSGCTLLCPFIARDTEATDTAASRATSRIVADDCLTFLPFPAKCARKPAIACVASCAMPIACVTGYTIASTSML